MKKRWLIIEPGKPSERTVILEQPVNQLGRGSEATICIDSRNVSTLHASVVLRESGASIIDLDSTNGTMVNGKRTISAELHDADRVELADIVVTFREEEVEERINVPTQGTETYFPAAAVDTVRLGELLDKAVREGWASAQETGSISDGVQMLQGSARRLDALYAILEHALHAGDRLTMIQTILAETGRLLGLEVIGLYLRDDQMFYIWEGDSLATEPRTDTVSATLLDKVLRTGTVAVVENVGADSSVLGFESLMRLRIQAVLCLPVAPRSAEVAGVLYCVSRRNGDLKLLEKDRLFLSACSTVVAAGLESLALASKAAETARADERNSMSRRYSPVIRRLAEERDNLSLKLHGFRSAELHGLDDRSSDGLREFLDRAARSDVPVLLLGETGVGKTVLARTIHEQGRAGRPFVTVDCTTLSPELVESELFGHEKGAFTGAFSRKEGRVAVAGNGTVFIDEVGELSPRLQGKLLRLIESGEYEPVGSTRTARSTARLLFATNRDLTREMELGTFRRDLYYRLNVLCHVIAPLRVNPERILSLASHFVKSYASLAGSSATGFTQPACEALLAHVWPGNIRELENVVMRALIRVAKGEISAEDLELDAFSASFAPSEYTEQADSADEEMDLKRARERLDRGYIERALTACNKNVSAAAKRLRISRNSLMELVKKYGL